MTISCWREGQEVWARINPSRARWRTLQVTIQQGFLLWMLMKPELTEQHIGAFVLIRRASVLYVARYDWVSTRLGCFGGWIPSLDARFSKQILIRSSDFIQTAAPQKRRKKGKKKTQPGCQIKVVRQCFVTQHIHQVAPQHMAFPMHVMPGFYLEINS